MKTYEASFKKAKSGRLKWAAGEFESEKTATDGLVNFINCRYQNQGYNLYGGPSERKQ